MRRAFTMADGRQWLQDLAKSASAVREVLCAAQVAVGAVMAADGSERNRFDSGAMRLFGSYGITARACAAVAVAHDATQRPRAHIPGRRLWPSTGRREWRNSSGMQLDIYRR